MPNALNLQEVNQEQALNLSKFFINAKQNMFLFGRKGTGKTHIVLQAAKDCNYKVAYINLSVIERADLAGFPDLKSEGDIITYKSPVYLPKLLDNETADQIILFDEVDKALPDVTAPLLEILQFKTINGKKINAASCILTGNLMNEGAYSNQISTALLDRGSKYILKFDFLHWVEWAKANQVHDLILGFLRSDPGFACGKDDDVAYASPSPRGWTQASMALLKAKELKIVDGETIAQIVSGFVGDEAGLRFKIWYEYYRKFEPFIHSIIDAGKMTFNFNELMPTEKLVFVISACYHAKQQVLTKSKKTMYLENLCDFFKNYQIDKELQVMGLYNSFDFEMITKQQLYKCKKFFDLYSNINLYANSK